MIQKNFIKMYEESFAKNFDLLISPPSQTIPVT